MTEPVPSRRPRREPTEAELQARAERRASKMILTSVNRVVAKTGLTRRQVAVLWGEIASGTCD